MKKLMAILFVAAAFVVGAFADDATFPTGSWVDEKWNGEWVIGANMDVQLKDSVSGELIYNFTEDKITNKKLEATTEGVVYSFTCKETERSYKFIKGLTISSDIILRVNPDWDDTDYQTTIKFKKASLF